MKRATLAPIVKIKAPHVRPEGIVTALGPKDIYALVAKPFFVFGYRSSFGVLVPLVRAPVESTLDFLSRRGVFKVA